jgi:hypothetical protein
MIDILIWRTIYKLNLIYNRSCNKEFPQIKLLASNICFNRIDCLVLKFLEAKLRNQENMHSHLPVWIVLKLNPSSESKSVKFKFPLNCFLTKDIMIWTPDFGWAATYTLCSSSKRWDGDRQNYLVSHGP